MLLLLLGNDTGGADGGKVVGAVVGNGRRRGMIDRSVPPSHAILSA